MDINGYYMAAVPDPVVAKDSVKPAPVRMNEVAAERYFNAGVLYINLERVKEKGSMKNEVLDYLIKNPNAQLLDQDALNSIYRDGILFLDSSWNYYARFVRINGENCLERKIYHYVGTSYTLYYQNEMDRLYYETVSRTPWGRKQGRKIIDDSIGKLVDRAEQLEKLIHGIAGNQKKRIFYGNENSAMHNLYELLSIRDGDYRIVDESGDMPNGVLPSYSFETLEKEQDEYVVFVLPQADGGKAMEKLDKLGLKRDIDYFVIPRLLMPHQGGYI